MDAAIQDYRQALFAATAAGLAALLVTPLLFGFSLDFASFVPLFVMASVPALALPYVAWRRLDAMRPALEAISLGLVVTLPVLVFTYAAMRLNRPLVDPLLVRMDNAIGFEWTAFLRLVDQSPTASIALAYGYTSFSWQLIFLPPLLCIVRLPARAYQMVLGYFILCTISSVIASWFPSVGAYVTHNLDPSSLHYINGKYGHLFLESFNAVREDPAFVLSIDNAGGILTFPSVHAGVAALCAWAAWASPTLRYPFLGLNLLMAISAITHGAHYLIDIFAGGAVAAISVVLVHAAAAGVRARRLSRLPAAAPAAA